jgi:hypothetical protein
LRGLATLPSYCSYAIFRLAGGLGFEPRLAESESGGGSLDLLLSNGAFPRWGPAAGLVVVSGEEARLPAFRVNLPSFERSWIIDGDGQVLGQLRDCGHQLTPSGASRRCHVPCGTMAIIPALSAKHRGPSAVMTCNVVAPSTICRFPELCGCLTKPSNGPGGLRA